jgi:hypothetical protein
MPNGFRGTDEAWARLEAPLLVLDPVLETFAREHDLSLARNYHNWPERSLKWGAPIERLIQIYLEDDTALTWNVWLCASEDRGAARYWKRAFLRQAVLIDEIERALPGLLEEALAQVNTWSQEQLEFATKLS